MTIGIQQSLPPAECDRRFRRLLLRCLGVLAIGWWGFADRGVLAQALGPHSSSLSGQAVITDESAHAASRVGEDSRAGELVAPVSLTFDAPPLEVDDPAVVCIDGDCACQPTRRVFAEALYWTVREGGSENWAQQITPLPQFGANMGSAQLIEAPFDWNAGYRVGLSTPKPDDVDVTVSYTNFRTSAAAQAAGEVYSAFLGNFYVGNPDGAIFGPHYRSASIDWDFAFHTIDLEVGRTFAVSPSLALRPFIGLKGAIINQTIVSRWNGPIDTPAVTYLFNSGVEQLTHDYWGLGPTFGVTADIPLYRGTRNTIGLYASPSAALMYGHWNFSDHYQNDGPTSTTIPTPTTIAIDTDPIDGATIMGRGTLGFEWKRQFARTTSVVRFGYEAQIWMNQIQFYTLNGGRFNNLASLQGGVLEIGINF